MPIHNAAADRRSCRSAVMTVLMLLVVASLPRAEASRAEQETAPPGSLPFDNIEQNIKENLFKAARNLEDSSTQQAQITNEVAKNIKNYHKNVKSIASTMGQVLNAKTSLTKAYHEELTKGEQTRVGPLELNIAEMLGEDNGQLETAGDTSAFDTGNSDNSALSQTYGSSQSPSRPMSSSRTNTGENQSASPTEAEAEMNPVSVADDDSFADGTGQQGDGLNPGADSEASLSPSSSSLAELSEEVATEQGADSLEDSEQEEAERAISEDMGEDSGARDSEGLENGEEGERQDSEEPVREELSRVKEMLPLELEEAEREVNNGQARPSSLSQLESEVGSEEVENQQYHVLPRHQYINHKRPHANTNRQGHLHDQDEQGRELASKVLAGIGELAVKAVPQIISAAINNPAVTQQGIDHFRNQGHGINTGHKTTGYKGNTKINHFRNHRNRAGRINHSGHKMRVSQLHRKHNHRASLDVRPRSFVKHRSAHHRHAHAKAIQDQSVEG